MLNREKLIKRRSNRLSRLDDGVDFYIIVVKGFLYATNVLKEYKNKEGGITVNVILKDETIWITKKGMSELFECSTDNIGLHLKNIYLEHELEKEATTEDFSVVWKEGDRQVKRTVEFYNLDAIIAVGYRVNSKKETQFRIWATNVLKEYMIKGFIINKVKMKNGPSFGKDYFDELHETIKEIRLSERRQYQKITDIFESTSVDYNADSEEAYTFSRLSKINYIMQLQEKLLLNSSMKE